VTSRPIARTGLLVLAAAIVVFELATAAWRTTTVSTILAKNVRKPPLLVRDADVDPFAYYAPTFSMVAAQHAIPKNALYTIVTGRERHALPPGLFVDIYRMWLMPRRYTTDLQQADWALTYWKASEIVGRPYTTEIGLGPGVNAVKLAPNVRP
jgi:hypothetical protein